VPISLGHDPTNFTRVDGSPPSPLEEIRQELEDAVHRLIRVNQAGGQCHRPGDDTRNKACSSEAVYRTQFSALGNTGRQSISVDLFMFIRCRLTLYTLWIRGTPGSKVAKIMPILEKQTNTNLASLLLAPPTQIENGPNSINLRSTLNVEYSTPEAFTFDDQ
jgi:hypothetical protein